MSNISPDKIVVVCHCKDNRSEVAFDDDRELDETIKFIDPVGCKGTNTWSEIPNASLLVVWGVNCPVAEPLQFPGEEGNDYDILIDILENSWKALHPGGSVYFGGMRYDKRLVGGIQTYIDNNRSKYQSWSVSCFTHDEVKEKLGFAINIKEQQKKAYIIFTKPASGGIKKKSTRSRRSKRSRKTKRNKK